MGSSCSRRALRRDEVPQLPVLRAVLAGLLGTWIGRRLDAMFQRWKDRRRQVKEGGP